MCEEEKSNVNSRLIEWLNRHGYSLEMKLGKRMNEANYFTRNSAYYIDQDTNKFREIDVIAQYKEITGFLNISFVFECKSSKSNPYVLFTSADTLNYRNKLFSFSYNSDSSKGILLEKGDEIESIPWLNKEGRVGYHFVQGFKDNQSDTYQAVTGVLKASKYILDSIKYPDAYNFVFPIILVEGELFECYLDENNEARFETIQRGFLLEDISIENSYSPCILVMKFDFLDSFLEEAYELTEKLSNLTKSKIKSKLMNIKI
ncbi:hypothetical protein DXC69_24670 [Paenibacillus polymyxa]|uniref:hypothetical protein n=1 Tax=Paenibacillus polymyxa TaxID=1406 RepID=UPI000EE24BE4|nr:hypothetical protein [Paenibacillus polymyxa]RGL29736.1 hypothetical protein DXC69_24670 [Paenibacillus polymyxa]UMR34455.1 hypothetical protein MJ749_17430 [Paenibacillus polymyxa]